MRRAEKVAGDFSSETESSLEMKASRMGTTPCYVKFIVSLHLLIGILAVVLFYNVLAVADDEYHDKKYHHHLFVVIWIPFFVFGTGISGITDIKDKFFPNHCTHIYWKILAVWH